MGAIMVRQKSAGAGGNEGVGGPLFYKMTGSGNDFVFLNARESGGVGTFESADGIKALCTRGAGVGADGAVFLGPSTVADVALRYYNADGSRAAPCGNATLCTVRLATVIGIEPRAGRRQRSGELRIETDAGVVAGRLLPDDLPEFDFGVVDVVDPQVAIGLVSGERAIGLAVAGVPHLVVHVEDLDAVNVAGHGRSLRSDACLGPDGANVDFVASAPATGWGIRTYERGAEGETLACGTGCVASAAVLAYWGVLDPAEPVQLLTRSGRPARVRLRPSRSTGGPASGSSRRWLASVAGEGRLVFRGELAGVA